MDSIACLTRNKSPYLPDLDADHELLQFEPFLYDQDPSCGNYETFEPGLDGFVADTFNSSSRLTQAIEYVRFQEERPINTEIVLQNGSAGSFELNGSKNFESPYIPQYDECPPNILTRERSRGAGTQSVECTECQQMFDSLHSLEQHTKKESHKIWRCSERNCGKAYPRRDTLSRHQLKHSAKGHACVRCQQNDKRKVFKRRDHLAEHIRKRHSPSTDGNNDEDPRKQEALQDIVKSLETVLGGNHKVLRGLGSTMTGLSDSSMTSVAETIAKRIAQAAADQSRGYDETCK